MEMHAVVLAAALVTGIVALEMRRAVASVVAVAVALALFAIAMAVAGALEVAVGGIVSAVVLALVFRWAFGRTGGDDTVGRMLKGAPAALGLATLVGFVIIALAVLQQNPLAAAGAETAGEASGGIGLLREALVVIAAAAGIWAMMRSTGRRDE
jgi:hypothetical protein